MAGPGRQRPRPMEPGCAAPAAGKPPPAVSRSPNLPAASAGPLLAGFTLLELMVVVVLVGILSAMIIPEMRGTYSDALLRSTSRQLVGLFSLASSRAISLGQTHRVRLEPGSGRYVVERRLRERGRRSEFIQAKEMPDGEGALDSRIAIEVRKPEDAAAAPEAGAAAGAPAQERSAAIEFYPDGTAQAAEVLLSDQEGFRLGLRISPVTARVKIIELGRP